MRTIFSLLTLLLFATAPAFSQTETHPFTLYTAAQYPVILDRLSREPYKGWMTRLTGTADEVLASNVDWTAGTTPKVTQALYGKLLATAYALTGSTAPNHRRYGEAAAKCLAGTPSGGYKSRFASDLDISEAAMHWAEAYDLLKGAGFDFEVEGFSGMEAVIRGNLAALRNYMGTYYATGFPIPEPGEIGKDFPPAALYFIQNSDNHHVKLLAALTVLSLAIYAEPGSPEDYSPAFNRFFSCLNNLTVTGGDAAKTPAGSWSEGPAYHEYTAQQYLPALTALENLGLFDYSLRPEVVNTHLLVPKMAMPDGYLPPWDDSEAAIADLAGLYASRHRSLADSPGLLWLWNMNGKPVKIAFLPDYLAQFDDALTTPASPAGLGWNPTEFFPESGFARFRDSWDPDAAYLLLLSENGEARVNGQAHEHPDPNSFILHAHGEMLMLDSGYGGFDRHDATRFAVHHNLILTDNAGPAGASQQFGSSGFWIANGSDAFLGNRFTTPGLDYALSATSYNAVGGTTDFTRQVLFPGKRYFLLYDRVTVTDQPRTVTLLLHGNGGGTSGGAFASRDGGGLWSREKAALRSFTVGTNDLTLGPARLGFETQDLAHAVYQRAPLLSHTVLRISQLCSRGRFLTLLLPRETGAVMPAPSILSLIPYDRGTGIRLALGDTTDYSVVRERGDVVRFTALGDTVSFEGEMAWFRIGPDKRIAQFFMVNGSALSSGGTTLLTASRAVTLSADFRDSLAYTGHVITGTSGATLTLAGVNPVRVTFRGADVPFTVTGGNAAFTVAGSGEWRVVTALQPPYDGRVEDIPGDQGHSLKLTWKASPSAGEGLVDSYRILRSRSPQLTEPIPLSRITSLDSLLYYEERYTILIGSVPADTLQFIDPFVPLNDVPYYYWLQAEGHGSLSKPAAASSEVGVETAAPLRFRLEPAYPNPFNPVTTLTFSLPEATRAVLSVYTVTGQRIAVLLDRRLQAGNHRITWNAAGYPSGVYLYTLTAGPHRATGKMLLLK